MQVTLPWGQEALSLNVPDTWTLHFPKVSAAAARQAEPTRAEEIDIIKEALAKPLKAQPISKNKFRAQRILIVVDDNTRPTPVHLFFHLVLDELKKGGADLKNVTVVSALGIHTPMTKEEMTAKIGAKNMAKVKFENHSATEVVKLQYMGETRRGTRVILNKLLAESDYIVSLGMIEPHLWAGFGGGLKNILPGLAAAETIAMHHEIIAEPPYHFNRVGMVPEKNSFRQDLEEVRAMIDRPIFCLNVVLNHNGQIVGAFAGDPISAHRAGVNFNNRLRGLHMEHQVHGIIVNSHPMDINFKQSMKCVGNSLPALKPGGAIMGFLRAERGIDDMHLSDDAKPVWLVKTLLRVLGPSNVMWFVKTLRRGISIEERFLMYYALQLVRAYDLFFHAPSISEDEVLRLGFFHNYMDPQDVIRTAAKKLPPDAHVAVFPEGGATYPLLGDKPVY